jgi:hypothetical protein
MVVMTAVSLQRWAAHLASRPPHWQLGALPSLRCFSPFTAVPSRPGGDARSAGAGLNGSPRSLGAAPRRPRHALRPAASYSIVTGGPPGSSDGSGGGSGQLKLIVYSKEGCHLCEGLKEKLEALLDRAAFLPSALRCSRQPLPPAALLTLMGCRWFSLLDNILLPWLGLAVSHRCCTCRLFWRPVTPLSPNLFFF